MNRFALALLTISAFAEPIFAQETIQFTGVRALRESVYQLVEQHGWPITYEEPLWRDLPSAPRQLLDNHGRLNLPTTLTADRFDISAIPTASSTNPGALLDSYIRAYHAQGNKGAFRVVQQKVYYHVQPDTSAGMISLLDTSISIPTSARTPEDTIAAIATSIRQIKGIKVGVDFAAAFGFKELFSGKKGPASQIVWGADGVTARDALVDLFSKSRTTFIYEFDCQPAAANEPEFCILSPNLIRVKTVGADGRPLTRVIQFDRQPSDGPHMPIEQ